MTLKYNLSYYLENMTVALNDEIEALKSGSGGTKINLIEGQFMYKTLDKYIYRFIVESEFAVIEDTPGQLVIPGRDEKNSIDVVIVSIEANELMLATEVNLGNYISEGILITTPYYLLEKLVKRLQEIKDKKLEINKKLVLDVFNGTSPEKINNTVYTSTDLNEQQNSALTSALQNNITYIWGPPGTGKTHTIGHIISNFVRAGKSVLMVSHTNSAIDTALIKLYQLLPDKEIFQEGKILRLGNPYKKSSELDLMLVDNIVERKGQKITEEKQNYKIKLNKIEKKLNVLIKSLNMWDELELEKNKLKKANDIIEKYDYELNELKQKLNRLTLNWEKDIAKLNKIENANFLVKFFSESPENIKNRIYITEKEIKNYKTEIDKLHDKISEENNNVTVIKQRIKKLQRKIDLEVGYVSKEKIHKEKKAFAKEIEELKNKVKKLDKQLNQLRDKVIQESMVIGTTLTKAFLDKNIYEREFAAVIIDEASMAPLPYIFFATGRARYHVIISGDFRQLSPIAVADTKSSDKWLKRDIYTHSGVIKNIDEKGYDEKVTMLHEQFRMKPDIMKAINDFYYNKLRVSQTCQPTIKEYDPPFDRDILFCDVSSINPWCTRPRNSNSRYNIYTALLAARLAKLALTKGVQEVGIITPYSAQAKLINKIIYDKKLHEKVKAATVHKFQGDEKELIIIDTVDGSPFKVGVLMRGSIGSDAMRLINVAVSRAKNKLLLINNYDYFKKHLSSNESIMKVLDKLYQTGAFIPPERFLYSYVDINNTNNFVDINEFKDKIITKNEATFYPTFISQLRLAKERVIIISPFVSKNRLSMLINHLRHLIDKGVEVIVVTRPANQQPGDKNEVENLLNELNKMGIIILYQRNIHEKVAFIDKIICWFGSLNILSQNKSSERMIGFSSARTIEQLFKNFQIDSYLNKIEHQKKVKIIQDKIKNNLLNYYPEQKCPECGSKMVLKFGKYGPFFGCSNYPGCDATVNIPYHLVEKVVNELSIPCSNENCDGIMKYRRSRNGSFLGCSNYPRCKNTISLR